MKLPNEGYFSKFTHVELARFFPEENRLKRVQDKKHQPILIPWADIYKFSSDHDDLGIYHSIRHYDLEQGGLEGPSLAPLHFDIDNKDDPESAYRDTQRLLRYFIEDVQIPYDAIRVYFSGMKGYHVECEPIAIRLNLIAENSAAIFRFAAEEFAQRLAITSFDYAVYDPRRIWRLAGSKHQKTGLYKIPCKDMMLNGASIDTISKAAEKKPTEEELLVPDQEFSPTAARFFSELVATYEDIIRERETDKLSNFLSQGSSSTVVHGDFVREYDPSSLRKHCPAVDEMIQKANTVHHLEHYERLFLCSLMTYTPEAIEHLQKIFSQCSDYNFHISDLHIRDWIRRRENGIGGRPYTCGKAKSSGIICSGCDDLQPKLYKNDLGAEHVADPSPIRFAYRYHEIGA